MSDDLPTLFSLPDSCALSVLIAFRWASADYQLQVLEPGENRGPAFLAINPAGQVPAVQVDGEPVLTEAHALLMLIADSHPESNLAPPSSQPVARYRLEQLLAFMTGEVHGAFVPVFSPCCFLDDDGWAAEIRRTALNRVRWLLKRLDARLGARTFILGERTVADPFLYVLSRWARTLHDDLTTMPNLARFRVDMEADPAVAASLRDHGMDPAGAPA